MKRTTPEQQQNIDDIAFADAQVESGKSALRNPDIDPKVAARVKNAIDYWQTRANTLRQTAHDNGW